MLPSCKQQTLTIGEQRNLRFSLSHVDVARRQSCAVLGACAEVLTYVNLFDFRKRLKGEVQTSKIKLKVTEKLFILVKIKRLLLFLNNNFSLTAAGKKENQSFIAKIKKTCIPTESCAKNL